MAKQLNCQCGFTASGPNVTVEQLQNVAVQHVKDSHPDLIREHGEAGVRAMTPSYIKDV